MRTDSLTRHFASRPTESSGQLASMSLNICLALTLFMRHFAAITNNVSCCLKALRSFQIPRGRRVVAMRDFVLDSGLESDAGGDSVARHEAVP